MIVGEGRTDREGLERKRMGRNSRREWHLSDHYSTRQSIVWREMQTSMTPACRCVCMWVWDIYSRLLSTSTIQYTYTFTHQTLAYNYVNLGLQQNKHSNEAINVTRPRDYIKWQPISDYSGSPFCTTTPSVLSSKRHYHIGSQSII